jgi:hypothetical protein
MKNRLSVCIVVLGGAMLCGATGNETKGPEDLGAHWARVSDRRQIEFILDGLRSAGHSGAAGEIMRRNAHAGSAIQISAPVRGGTTQVTLHGDAATAEFPGAGMLQFARSDGGWRAVSGIIPAAPGSPLSAVVAGQTTGFSSGATFIETPISADQGIDRLSKTWTESKLGRALFSTPGPTASYYTAHYMQSAPYVTATYVQFVVDPSWNRIVYGNMNAWIKSFSDLIGPTSIAVDPSGRVFVGESGRQQVTVLRLEGDGSNAQLRPLFTLSGVTAPSAVAHSDNGTPLDPTDDILYVADAAKGTVVKYSLSATGGTLVTSFPGFDSPTGIAVGRWNGTNNGFIYIIDQVAKRVRVLEDGGTTLTAVAEYRGGYDSYFSSIAVDHFGDVYIADNTSSRLLKLTASLEPLDEEGGGGMYAALAAVNVPFGLITVDGKGTYWAGFDQLFAVEQWTPESGARRRTLGLRLKDIQFTTDENSSRIAGRFTLTGFGTVGAHVYDASGNIVKTLIATAMVSGQKDIAWDRRDDSGKLVTPGEYKYELLATDSYKGETTTASALWTLPLYYEELGGTDDPHLTRGTPVHWGLFSASQDQQSVQYRFTGLNPTGTYAVSAEYVAPPDGAPRLQDLTAAGLKLHEALSVGPTVSTTGFLDIPPAAFSSGELLLSVNSRDAGSAVVSRLVLKETGRGFSSAPGGAPVPTRYAIEQNYPNPFNPSTVIRYDIPQAGPVSLIVHDINGREVARLVNEIEPAGRYEVRFDAGRARNGGIASGVYFYTVRAGTFTQTRKMMLIK